MNLFLHLLFFVILSQQVFSKVAKISTKESKDGRCGKEFGVCQKGFCCSQIGWCGNSDFHCDVENGCQSEFGTCKGDPANYRKVSIDGRCGKEFGVCQKGYCCSQIGWCGKSDFHCDVENGCQSEFGTCKGDPANYRKVSIDGRCGKEFGVCQKGYCCSKWGWCGKTDFHCGINEDDQSEFNIYNGKSNDKGEKEKKEKETKEENKEKENKEEKKEEKKEKETKEETKEEKKEKETKEENKEKENKGIEKEECNEHFNDIDIIIIEMIAKELNITSCEAGNVYDYTDKKEAIFEKALNNSISNNLSKDECLNECKKANTDLKDCFKNTNITILEEYSSKFYGGDIGCEGNCMLIKELTEVKKWNVDYLKEYIDEYVKEHATEYVDEEEEIETTIVNEDSESNNKSIDKVKRKNNECNPERKVEVMQYINDIPQVRKIDDKTIINEVNGCGPKIHSFFSLNNMLIEHNEKYTEEFEPACNAHDICYACKVEKSECDKSIFVNMKKICQKKYPINLDQFDGEFFSISSMKYISKEDMERTINEMEYIPFQELPIFIAEFIDEHDNIKLALKIVFEVLWAYKTGPYANVARLAITTILQQLLKSKGHKGDDFDLMKIIWESIWIHEASKPQNYVRLLLMTIPGLRESIIRESINDPLKVYKDRYNCERWASAYASIINGDSDNEYEADVDPELKNTCKIPIIKSFLVKNSFYVEGISKVDSNKSSDERADQLNKLYDCEYESDFPFSLATDEKINEILDDFNAKSGDITISLLWNTPDDIDLHVLTPSGYEIYYSDKKGGGGELDVDIIPEYDDYNNHAENIYFEDPDVGDYKVWIENFNDRTNDSASDYTVRVIIDGKSKVFTGTIDKSKSKIDIMSFSYVKEEKDFCNNIYSSVGGSLPNHCKDDIFRGICDEFIKMNYSTTEICSIMFQNADDKLKCDNVSKKNSSSDFCKELFSSELSNNNKSQEKKIEAKFGSVGEVPKVKRRDIIDKYKGICEVNSFKKICNEFVKKKESEKKICTLLFSLDHDTSDLGISKCLIVADQNNDKTQKKIEAISVGKVE